MSDTWIGLATYFVSLCLLYVAAILVYRFFFHPLVHIPGPTLAKATYLYEWYYDLYLSGQYTFKLKELHKQYGMSPFHALRGMLSDQRAQGPIIRINPDEVHINDPDYFDEVFNQTNGRAEKPLQVAEAFGPYPAVN